MTTKTGNARELGGARTGAGEGGEPAKLPALFPGIALSARADDYAPMK